MEITFTVQNLKCGGCANTIVKALEKLKGVESVKVDPDASKVLVVANQDLEQGTVEQKLTDIGYPLLDAPNSTFQKVNSYLSCMKGKLN